MLHRRSLLAGLIAVVAAPAIVRYQSIMPVKALAPADLVNRTVWESGPWRYVSRDGVNWVECTHLPLNVGVADPDVAAEFYRKVDETVVYDKRIVEQSVEGRWYADPPDRYNGELRPPELVRQCSVFYEKSIVEQNMKPEWLVEDVFHRGVK